MRKFYFVFFCIFSSFSFQSYAQAPRLLLNEVSIDPDGTDKPYEYIELKGFASTLLSHVYLVIIEGDGTASGKADMVTSLNGITVGSNGLIMLKSPTGGHTPAAETTVVSDAQFDASSGGIENGTNSFLLIYSTIPIVEGTDYDADNNGSLEALPIGAEILDAFGVNDGDSGDYVYGGVSLTLSASNPPGAATRFPGNNATLSEPAWYFGNLTGGNTSLAFHASQRSTNFPTGAQLSPGGINAGGPSIPLPVQLISFTAKRYNNQVQLSWITTSESNNTGFEIEKKNNQTSLFEKTGFVVSKAVSGNSNSALTYQFAEVNITKGVSLYRLRQVDIDGRSTYSTIRIVDGIKSKASLLIYPNPSAGTINIVFTDAGSKTVKLFDISGRLCRTWNNYSDQILQLTDMNTGVYTVHIKLSGSTKTEVERVVVSK